jgi:hypothetical protein
MHLNFTQELEVFEAETTFTAADFVRWHEEESKFLSVAKRKEPEEVTLKALYVEAMENYFAIE